LLHVAFLQKLTDRVNQKKTRTTFAQGKKEKGLPMLILQIALLLGALLAPYLIWSRYNSLKKTVYHGDATVLTMSLLSSDRQNSLDYDFLHVEIPGQPSALAKVSRKRLATLDKTSLAVKVTISIAKYPFGKPFVDSIVWPGETSAEDGGDGEYRGLGLSGLYLMLGFGSMIAPLLLLHTATALALHVWLYSAALLFGASSFSFGMLKPAAKLNRKDMSASVLNIPLGKGLFSAVLLFAICALGTAACFWSVGIWTMIPGINCAMALGGLAAVFIKLRNQEKAGQ
jgi:hypothetical protein